MKHSFLALFMLLLVSCKDDKGKVETLKKEVFAMHDEVMPKMETIMELRESISKDIAQTDSLLKLKSIEKLQQHKVEALQLGEALDDADGRMMEWMHSFKADSIETLKPEAALLYLESEKKKMSIVRDKTVESIVKAQQFLNSKP